MLGCCCRPKPVQFTGFCCRLYRLATLSCRTLIKGFVVAALLFLSLLDVGFTLLHMCMCATHGTGLSPSLLPVVKLLISRLKEELAIFSYHYIAHDNQVPLYTGNPKCDTGVGFGVIVRSLVLWRQTCAVLPLLRC